MCDISDARLRDIVTEIIDCREEKKHFRKSQLCKCLKFKSSVLVLAIEPLINIFGFFLLANKIPICESSAVSSIDSVQSRGASLA